MNFERRFELKMIYSLDAVYKSTTFTPYLKTNIFTKDGANGSFKLMTDNHRTDFIYYYF